MAWVDRKLYITLNVKMFQKKSSSLFFMLPCILFGSEGVATKLYVLRFGEVENNLSALHQTVWQCLISGVESCIYLIFCSTVFQELKTFLIHKVTSCFVVIPSSFMGLMLAFGWLIDCMFIPRIRLKLGIWSRNW